ncbi:MAG TPA: ABC transporter ATP-binding protein [Firmicutes bacterium]|jgi:peptide/nickel transport system ATP-binding protein|nr:ABC transporter ATP-binding protein [Bacillota bacterium]
MNLLEGHGLRKYYHRRGYQIQAVDGVDISMKEHEALGLVGESGSGKSTLMRLLLLLERPSAGDLYFRGGKLNSGGAQRWSHFRREVQAVFQDAAASLNPRLSVGRIVAEPLLNFGPELGSHRIDERVAAALERVGLQRDDRRRYPHEFSGGQQRRIALARALVADPPLILCDEITSGLDLSVQAKLLNLFRDLQEESRAGFLFISHDLGAMRYLCSRVAVIYAGKIVEELPVSSLEQPLHPYTQALLAAEAQLFAPSEMYLLEGEPPDPAAYPAGCRFHPRCPIRMKRCTEESPRLTTVRVGHRAACFTAH